MGISARDRCVLVVVICVRWKRCEEVVISFGQPVLVRYSSPERSIEVVIVAEVFRGDWIMFCDINGARNHIEVKVWWWGWVGGLRGGKCVKSSHDRRIA